MQVGYAVPYAVCPCAAPLHCAAPSHLANILNLALVEVLVEHTRVIRGRTASREGDDAPHSLPRCE